MAKAFIPVDRDQPMLLPADMREWLADDDPVYTVVFLVEKVLDTTALVAGWGRLGGPGRAPYDPLMLASLLIWASLDGGEQSCEKIVRRCRRDVAYRYICAGRVPDEDTLRRFREHMLPRMAAWENTVLQACALAGLGDFSLCGIDGTKLQAAASKKANRTAAGLKRIGAELEVAQMARQGGARPAPPRLAGTPADVAPTTGKRARVAAAAARLAARDRAAAQAEAAKVAAWQARKAADPHMPGPPPTAARLAHAEGKLAELTARQQAKHDLWRVRCQTATASGGPRPTGPAPKIDDHKEVVRWREHVQQLRDQAASPPATTSGQDSSKDRKQPVANLTDPDSALLPTKDGWVQGYNCQAGATLDGLLVTGALGDNPADVTYGAQMLTQLTHARDLFITTRTTAGIVCTCGYHLPEPDPHTHPNHHARWRTDIDTCPRHHGLYIDWALLDAGYLSCDNLTTPGPPRLIAIGKTRDQLHAATQQPTTGPPDPNTDPHHQNAHHLHTPAGAAAYRLRGHICERPFAHIKHNKGLSTLHTRGRANATAEWTFIRTSHNLHILTQAIRTGQVTTSYLAAALATIRTTHPRTTNA